MEKSTDVAYDAYVDVDVDVVTAAAGGVNVNQEGLLRNIRSLWIDSYHLFDDYARFDRNVSKPVSVGQQSSKEKEKLEVASEVGDDTSEEDSEDLSGSEDDRNDVVGNGYVQEHNEELVKVGGDGLMDHVDAEFPFIPDAQVQIQEECLGDSNSLSKSPGFKDFINEKVVEVSKC
ncbi:hypothetical protein L1987_28055 [Smallanthus sonchifolius]|uniref:Uncharacterized protein n=1 Tax=Smallanthus sonchifolius TaxID=185202 RepID=A0ACB9IEP0_9ASTR|nr:hypothetical protein L1987_28055 [Smallanthus sonchifolius]